VFQHAEAKQDLTEILQLVDHEDQYIFDQMG
jgi:hypothetical protein